jgi:DNA-binding NarL/FixJ family response regulator
MTISILLVDDHVIFRNGVRALLEATTKFHIAANLERSELQALPLAA